MKNLLFASLILALTRQSLGYYYDNPQIIKGNNGKYYEVTMSASRKMYETRVPSNEQVFIIKHLNQPPFAPYQTQQPHIYPQRTFNNYQQHFKPHFNQYNGIMAANNAQHHYNQFAAHPNYQQQVANAYQQPYGRMAHEQQRIIGATAQSRALPPATQHQQQYKYQLLQPPPLPHNNLPYSNHGLKDVVSQKPKYFSQSEAGQLDVYPYKQIDGNPRPFTRTVKRCDVSGRCEPLKVTQKSNKSPEVKGRRMLPYSEVVMPQYPHN